jgi:hypothetical protein
MDVGLWKIVNLGSWWEEWVWFDLALIQSGWGKRDSGVEHAGSIFSLLQLVWVLGSWAMVLWVCLSMALLLLLHGLSFCYNNFPTTCITKQNSFIDVVYQYQIQS